MPPEKSSRRLGRGLDALFNAPASPLTTQVPAESALQDLPVGQISPNPFQPRRNFSPAELLELEESLKTSGLLQPVTVRPSRSGSGYELIAGERRLRAATNLGWATIPAVVKDMTDREILTLALIENLQRFDLNPVEEAEGYDRLIREFEYTQQTVAALVGKNRSTVANVIRILNLPASIREMIQDGRLTAGQARPLIGMDDEKRAVALARDIAEHEWSAREVERRVRETPAAPGVIKRGRPKKEDTRPAEVRSIEQRLRKHFQTDVSITLKSENRGAVVLGFYSAEDLERLVEAMGIHDVQQ